MEQSVFDLEVTVTVVLSCVGRIVLSATVKFCAYMFQFLMGTLMLNFLLSSNVIGVQGHDDDSENSKSEDDGDDEDDDDGVDEEVPLKGFAAKSKLNWLQEIIVFT